MQLLVTADSFEATEAGRAVLVALWTVTDGAARQTLASKRSSIAVPLESTGDAAIVAAMTKAVDDLARQIAPALARSGGGRR